MPDEVTDASSHEQLVICLLWVDNKLQPIEEFPGLYILEQIDSDTILDALEGTLLRMNIKLANCRGLCYSGATSMSGKKTVVATQ